MKYLLALAAIGAGWLAGTSWPAFIVILGTFVIALYQWDRVATRKHKLAQMRRPGSISPTRSRSGRA